MSGEEYVENPHGFVIHHIDGNRTNNILNNLVLMSATYHNAIHGEVNVRFNDYKKSHPIIPKPKSKPKPRSLDITVLDKWRKAEMEAQDNWRTAVFKTLNDLGYNS